MWFSISIDITSRNNPDEISIWKSDAALCNIPHEKINQCLTDINRCLTDIFKI